MRVGSVILYPIKGARGVSRQEHDLALAGLDGDRRWMLVDEAGRFVSQRELPRLALLEANPDEDGLHLSFPDKGERFAPVPEGEDRLTVTIWKDAVEAALAAPQDSAALSAWLGRPLRLVFFDETSHRVASRDWVDHDAPVAFADGFPLLVATAASLRETNRRIVQNGGEAVPMNRFRPNIVVEDAEAFAEDGWATIRVGEVVIDLVKPCARCAVTTVDQDRGERDGKEPLAVLGRTHKSGDPRAPGALFGWNAVPRATGRIRVGDTVEILDRRDGGWPIAG